MKHLIVTIPFLILFLFNGQAQDSSGLSKSLVTPYSDSLLKPIFYRAYVNRNFRQGYLVTIRDSALYLAGMKTPYSEQVDILNYYEKVSYRQINTIKLSRPHVKGKSTLIGMVIGIAAGVAIGFASGDDHGWFALSAADKAVVGLFIGAGAGALVGAAIGAANEKKFMIDGEWKSLEDMKMSLRRIR